MILKNKYKIVFDEHNKMSLAIKVGIFYDEDYTKHNPDSVYQKIRLFTLCYRPRYNDFVQISDISDLPKRLRKRYLDAYNQEQTLEELENIGIHDFRQIEGIINKYHDYQDFLVYEKYRNGLEEGNDRVYQKLLEVKSIVENK